MKKKTLENVTITGLGYGGIGIGVLENGKKVLVKGGLPGSVVDGNVIKRKKDYIELQITRVHSYDKELVQSDVACPHYLFPYAENSTIAHHKQGCGGCKRQIVGYAKQLELKQIMVADSLRRVPACQKISLPAVIPSPLQLKYRNKIEFSFGTFRSYHDEIGKSDEKDGKYDEFTTLGFHQQGRFAQIVDIDQCFLVSERMHEVFMLLKNALLISGLPVYRIKTHEGLLRHMVIREGVHTGQMMVMLSIATQRLVQNPDGEKIWKALLQEWEQNSKIRAIVTSLVIITNNGMADIVHHGGAELTTVWGEGRIFEELHFDHEVGTFQISPFSFFQTNTLGAEVLFRTAFSMVGSIKRTVLDLYCGSGTIGLCALKQGIGDRVVGIEIVEEAIRDAEKNASINGLADRAHFFAGKAEQLVRTLPQLRSLLDELDLIIVDPPREGLHKSVIEFLLELRESHRPKLLYISCNPVTFARDVALLTEGGWTLNTLQPVDMFPQTYHVEMIGVLKA